MKIIYLEETTSTNDVVASLGKKGAENFTTVRANFQTKGRGRMGNVWRTYSGTSLAFSVLIKEHKFSELLPLAVSVALCETLNEYDNCLIKWPNDILLNNNKIAGILIEKVSDAKSFYVVGVGINVNKPKEKDFIGGYLSQNITKNINILELFDKILNNIKQLDCDLKKQGWEKSIIAKKYENYCTTLGKHITFKKAGAVFQGEALEINSNGALIVETSFGLIALESAEIIKQGSYSSWETSKINK